MLYALYSTSVSKCCCCPLVVEYRRAGRRCRRLHGGVTGRQRRVGEVARLVVVETNAQLRQLGEVDSQQVASRVHVLRVQTLHVNDLTVMHAALNELQR